MTSSGDDVPDMPPAPLLDDATIDAILDGGHASPGTEPLTAFAAGVLALAEDPPPPPSPELAAFLAHGGPTLTVERATVVIPIRARHRSVLARAAGLSLAMKVGFATAAAAAGVVGAGAAGVLPGPASGIVRDAIEVVTPVEFGDTDPRGGGPRGGEADRRDSDDAPGDAQDPSLPGEHGDRVSSDATGESDGEPGVDGPTVAEQAPGAANRPTVPPGQPGGTPPATTPQGTPGGPAGTPGATAPGPGDTPGATAPGATADGTAIDPQQAQADATGGQPSPGP